ncbi:MAG TPA: hypothetical protein VJ327_02915 [Patescibacteria group bacterium]|nr:hypothetical protein [Patescibacteria group bacterium]
MSIGNSVSISSRLENAVCVLCSIIQKQTYFSESPSPSEYELRRELVACILGSQVTYEIAKYYLELIEKTGLLSDNWWNKKRQGFESRVYNIFSSESSRDSGIGRYRFPRVRAYQLAEARDSISTQPLVERLTGGTEPKKIRYKLVAEISGLGPKQSSMFLRNIGITNDLSILDTHVLRFMFIQKLLPSFNQNRISSISAYEQVESVMTSYANTLGYPVGCLDRAIWATMRAARELKI